MKGENRRFMLVVMVSFFILLAGITATTLIFTINSINRNADTSRKSLERLIRESLEEKAMEFSRMLRNPFIQDFFARGMGGDPKRGVIALFNMLIISFEDPYYLAIVQNGEVVASKLPEEIGKPAPGDLLVKGTEMLNSFRMKTGDLIMISSPLDEKLRVVVVKDITKEIQEIDKPFSQQKSRVLWVSLALLGVFLVFAVLIALLVIGPANSRYISRPIKELEEKALRIMDGDTTVEIEVDEKSDYYALQALLDSMRMLLHKSEQ